MLSVTRSSTRRLLAATAALATSGLLAGCGAVTGAVTGEEQGQGGGREVVAAFYPLAWVTERVAGDAWEVSNLTTPGGEPHDLELSISATASLAAADLVVYLDGFQPAVDDAIDTNAEGATIDAADVVDLQPVADHSGEGHTEEEHTGEDHADEGHAEEDHAHGDEHAGDEHAEEEHAGEDGAHEGHSHEAGEPDPHFWQDPARMALLADAVAEELASLDEAGAEDYRRNAEDLRGELEQLDQEYADGLARCERDTVVVSHDAFGYLARYGLHLEPIAGLTPDAEPTPAALAALGELIREEGLTTVFSERLASPAMAETLASDLDIETGVLDPVEGLTDETSGEDYLSLMRANLTALQEANGC